MEGELIRITMIMITQRQRQTLFWINTKNWNAEKIHNVLHKHPNSCNIGSHFVYLAFQSAVQVFKATVLLALLMCKQSPTQRTKRTFVITVKRCVNRNVVLEKLLT